MRGAHHADAAARQHGEHDHDRHDDDQLGDGRAGDGYHERSFPKAGPVAAVLMIVSF